MIRHGWWVLGFGPNYIDYGLYISTPEPILIWAELLLNTGKQQDPLASANRQPYINHWIWVEPQNFVRWVPIKKEENLQGQVRRLWNTVQHLPPYGEASIWSGVFN